LSKVLENVVHKRLYSFLEARNVLYKCQYGFRNRHSTVQAVTDFVIDNIKARKNNQRTFAIYLDLSKAFDTTDHKILINKLEYYGMRGQSLNWFKSYFYDRTQYIQYKGISSEKQCITCGVPQGSVLGPLLFIIYTNDLPLSLTDTKAILFSYDTTLYASSKRPDELYHKINNDLDCPWDWFKANKLSLNIAKTNYMLFPYGNDHANNGFCVCIVSVLCLYWY